jgi:hypothetical protein
VISIDRHDSSSKNVTWAQNYTSKYLSLQMFVLKVSICIDSSDTSPTKSKYDTRPQSF